jgi:hypothetical protein
MNLGVGAHADRCVGEHLLFCGRLRFCRVNAGKPCHKGADHRHKEGTRPRSRKELWQVWQTGKGAQEMSDRVSPRGPVFVVHCQVQQARSLSKCENVWRNQPVKPPAACTWRTSLAAAFPAGAGGCCAFWAKKVWPLSQHAFGRLPSAWQSSGTEPFKMRSSPVGVVVIHTLLEERPTIREAH